MNNWTPSPARLRAIADHVHSVGSYTQAIEIDLAAARMAAMEAVLRDIMTDCWDKDPEEALIAIRRQAEAALK